LINPILHKAHIEYAIELVLLNYCNEQLYHAKQVLFKLINIKIYYFN